MSRRLSPTREPEVGLDEPSHNEEGLVIGSQSKPKALSTGWTVFGFGSLFCLVIIGMFSLGFVLGQEWGQKRSDFHWMNLNLKFEQQQKQLTQKKLSEVQVSRLENPNIMLRELKSGLAQMHELGEELKLKLIDTHGLYANMVDLPERLRGLENLIKQWETSKISLVEDLCPASESLPRMLPSHVKTAKK